MKRFLFLVLLLGPLWAVAATPEKITFCAYNLRNYVRMERFSHGKPEPDLPKPEKEIAAVVKFLTDIKPDVLGVSEIGQEQELLDLQSRLKAAGLDLPNTEYCHGGDPVRRIALLTRFPIKQRNSQTELHYQIGDQIFPVQRGILDVVLEPKEGIEMHFIGVHLKSKRPVPEADQALMRRNEAHLLREHLDKIFAEHPDERLLVYGDCNEDAHEAPILDIAGIPKTPGNLHQVHVKDERGETWTHFWKEQDLYSRLDYFFTSQAMGRLIDHKGSRIYDVPEFYTGSDHRPIVARINLKTSSR